MPITWVRVRHPDLGETTIPTRSLGRYQARGWTPTELPTTTSTAGEPQAESVAPPASSIEPGDTTGFPTRTGPFRSKKES